ncbi:elongator complex protein 6 isoform X1 [Andrena cerasifolii]
MDPVSDILGIDTVNMGGKLILIEERHDSNANFLLNSIISNALKKNFGICFILFHNTLNHYHNVGMKFGYNLTALKGEGKVTVVEPMKIITSTIECTNEEAADNLNTAFADLTSDSNGNIIHNLLRIIKNEYQKMTEHNESVIIISEDVNHLYNLGFNLSDPMYYVRYLRSLIQLDIVSQLCIVTHTYKHELRSCVPNTFANGLKHMAHLYVVVDPFETGHSSDVCGKITINWRTDCIRKKYNYSEIARYIYTVSDRQVKIYTPGTPAMLV